MLSNGDFNGRPTVNVRMKNGNHYDLLLPSQMNTLAQASGLGTSSTEEKVLKRAAAMMSEAVTSGGCEKHEAAVRKRPAAASVEERAKKKAKDLLEKRLATDAPYGRCIHCDCQAALTLIPPCFEKNSDPASRRTPLVGCPRFRTKLCSEYVRPARSDDVLPTKLVRRR